VPVEILIEQSEVAFRGLCPKCAKAAVRDTAKARNTKGHHFQIMSSLIIKDLHATVAVRKSCAA
jgi:hypothetical protein